MRRVAALLGVVAVYYLGRMRCPHCVRAEGLVRVANRDRDLYLDECRRLTLVDTRVQSSS